jgi:hypothetical protein
MNRARSWWLGLGGAAVLAAIVGAGVVMAQTPSTTPTKTDPIPGTTAAAGKDGTHKPNEDATHEAGEDPTREALEDSGKGFDGKHSGGRGDHKPNEDADHEKGESPDREAGEDADASATPGPTN